MKGEKADESDHFPAENATPLRRRLFTRTESPTPARSLPRLPVARAHPRPGRVLSREHQPSVADVLEWVSAETARRSP